jgi:hypothetical protein
LADSAYAAYISYWQTIEKRKERAHEIWLPFSDLENPDAVARTGDKKLIVHQNLRVAIQTYVNGAMAKDLREKPDSAAIRQIVRLRKTAMASSHSRTEAGRLRTEEERRTAIWQLAALAGGTGPSAEAAYRALVHVRWHGPQRIHAFAILRLKAVGAVMGHKAETLAEQGLLATLRATSFRTLLSWLEDIYKETRLPQRVVQRALGIFDRRLEIEVDDILEMRGPDYPPMDRVRFQELRKHLTAAA